MIFALHWGPTLHAAPTRYIFMDAMSLHTLFVPTCSSKGLRDVISICRDAGDRGVVVLGEPFRFPILARD